MEYEEQKWMARALELAKKGVGFVSPNPLVGAVVVKNGKIIGEGWHEKYGEKHAERNAIENAEKKGFSVEGTTLVVTLEPCAHMGKTPPCADLICEKKIQKVILGATEENPISSGGIARLRAANIEVKCGVLEAECRAVNRFFFHGLAQQRPFFLGKIATCGNGFVAENPGKRSHISGKKAQRFVHQLRHECDAILVGKNTIVTDNPLLTTRFQKNPSHPLRIFFDRKKEVPQSAHVFDDANFLQISEENCPHQNGKCNLNALGKMLFARGIRSVLIEGGPRTMQGFLDEHLLDELIVIKSKKIFFENGVAAFSEFAKTATETKRENGETDTAIFFEALPAISR